MEYIVTRGKLGPDDTVAPLVIEESDAVSQLTLEEALNEVRLLLSEGKMNVAIEDLDGNAISGDELAACCRCEKMLTSDLKAISY